MRCALGAQRSYYRRGRSPRGFEPRSRPSTAFVVWASVGETLIYLLHGLGRSRSPTTSPEFPSAGKSPTTRSTASRTGMTARATRCCRGRRCSASTVVTGMAATRAVRKIACTSAGCARRCGGEFKSSYAVIANGWSPSWRSIAEWRSRPPASRLPKRPRRQMPAPING